MARRAGGLDVFYPIVPDFAWLERLVPLGVKTIQLRLKDASPQRVRREIAASMEVCARHGCQLIVNDYWQEALALGADYIHLGQEDLADADVPAIHAKGARLGISTHSEAELAIALAAEPGLCRAGAHLRDAPQGHEMGAAGARPPRRLEGAASAACRWSPSAASRRRGPMAWWRPVPTASP